MDIYSLKPGQVAHSAADTIEKKTARLNLATDVEADNPFATLMLEFMMRKRTKSA